MAIALIIKFEYCVFFVKNVFTCFIENVLRFCWKINASQVQYLYIYM